MEKKEYPDYHQTYMDKVQGKNALQELEDSFTLWEDFIMDLEEDKGDFAYANGKWTVKEVLQHIVDTERVFQFRALSFARNEKAELNGFDHNVYVQESRCNFKTVEDIDNEFVVTRNATLALFRSFDEDQLKRMGKCSGNEMSVRALGNLMGGHMRHHLIILNSKYL
ncbi:MAG: hypothetical protein ACI9YL_000597 [Luteibaculaceae bacterium]|jgi:hypothetical protein